MGLIQRDNNYGVDVPIDRFQFDLYQSLSTEFGNWDSYPRVYKNERKKDNTDYITAEHAIDNQFDYLSVLYNDNKDMVSFFFKDNESSIDYVIGKTTVSFIVQCDLNKIYPTETNRADERLKRDILTEISRQPYFNVIRTIDGVESVYREFRKDELMYSNISPRHIVRFDIEVDYNYNCCC